MNKKKTAQKESLSSRLSYALDQLGISQAELARRIQVNRQAIQYLCSSGTNKTKFSYEIAEALGIHVDWLVTGKGKMIVKASPEQQLLSEQKVVPILKWNQIRDWVNGQLDRSTLSDWTTVHEKLGEHLYALKLKDNAMFPRFDSETTIIVDPHRSPTASCFVVVYIKRLHDIVFRRLACENDQQALYAYNEAGYKELPLRNEDILLGCMIEAKWSAFTSY